MLTLEFPAGALSAKSVLYNASANPEQSPYYISPSHPELRAAGGAHSSPHGQDPLNTRGRNHGQLNGPSVLQPLVQSNRAHSPRAQRSNGDIASRAPAGALERRPSASYGHHRQTSIVHGMTHHSRNPSLTNSSSLNHRSPQLVANNVSHTGAGSESSYLNTSIADSSDIHFNGSSSGTLSGSLHSFPSDVKFFFEGGETNDLGENAITQKRIDRKQSAKHRRDHNRSQSKHQNLPEQPSVGEYAMNHIFESVSESL